MATRTVTIEIGSARHALALDLFTADGATHFDLPDRANDGTATARIIAAWMDHYRVDSLEESEAALRTRCRDLLELAACPACTGVDPDDIERDRRNCDEMCPRRCKGHCVKCGGCGEVLACITCGSPRDFVDIETCECCAAGLL